MASKLLLVLHSHIPYVKRQGRWPFGEVWLFEAMAETYIPLLRNWNRLQEEGLSAPVTISFSPPLLEQIRSQYIHRQFVEYLHEKERLALEDERWYVSQSDHEMAQLANYYYRFYQDIRRDYLVELDGNIIEAARRLQEAGQFEIITTAASHAYLPLLDRNSLKYQIYWAQKTYEKHFNAAPRGFWLPECGYFQGVEDLLIRYGFKYFFVDSHALEGGHPCSVFSGGGDEPLLVEAEPFVQTGLSTYCPYKVKNKDIMVLGRNAMVSQQVWSADSGYPGDPRYREFHRQSHRSGYKYWQVTDRFNSLDTKKCYNPEQAQQLTQYHAQDFIRSIMSTGHEAEAMGYPEPLIVGCYDTELFGHWWWEGIDWLDTVMRGFIAEPELDFTLPSQIPDELPEAQVFESSWGMGGKHYVWENPETNWMWDIIRRANREFEALEIWPSAPEMRRQTYRQILRELILLESSDWLFMVSNNLTRDYALKRFFEHYSKFTRLVSVFKSGNYTESFLQWLNRIQLEDDLLDDL
ncbi:MAG: DUF1957 domain-containing protein [Syntrophomonadaceae bacterium]|nr:DUF1957 domain-containing protein [Syntrophomonadaceae bacterium]